MTSKLKTSTISGVALLNSNNVFSAKQTFDTVVKVQEALEKFTQIPTPPNSVQNIDVLSSASHYFQSNCTSDFTLNIRGDSTSTLDSVMGIGESISLSVMVNNGPTAYYATAISIDGVLVTPKWIGAIPTSGDINCIDIYTITIVKTYASIFNVIASKNRAKDIADTEIVVPPTDNNINLIIDANTLNYNIKDQIAGAYVSGKTKVTLTINSGIYVNSSNKNTPALDTGIGWVAGDSIVINNNGWIAGKGGIAGTGANYYGGLTAGGNGGAAIVLGFPTTINNLGTIFGGGGGGGGGGDGNDSDTGGGLNGGVGAGFNPGDSGIGTNGTGTVGGQLGLPGANGGTHGSGGGYGGGGGGGGADGGDGGYGIQGSGHGGSGGFAVGGVHGPAIVANSNLITWLSDQTKVYGGII